MKNRSKFPLEKNIVNEIIAALRSQGVVFVRKIHGDPYQTNGIPDILATEPTTGRFVALEVKRSNVGKATSLQYKALNEINVSNGYATIVTNAEQAVVAMQNAANGYTVALAEALADSMRECMLLCHPKGRILCKLERADGKRAWLVEYVTKP